MSGAELAPGQWTADRANAWYDAQPWICGFNYIPSTAVNFMEMWRGETFDPETIGRELGWAGQIGMNAIRTNPQLLVWKHDRTGFFDRIDRVLDLAFANGIRTVLCPFDDCGFSGTEPEWAPQPDPIPDVHNSRALACPGRAAVMDRSRWPEFEDYLKDILARFAKDDRILFWDLYNEPTNRVLFLPTGFAEGDPAQVACSHALMKDCFAWAREVAPDHPLTVAPWIIPSPDSDDLPYQSPAEQDALALSDLITFHAYTTTDRVARFVDMLAAWGRPILTTEWMARGVASRIEDQLPFYRSHRIGAFQWGFIQGRSQTHLPWPGEILSAHGGTIHRDIWFHDLLYADGRPYDPAEVEIIRQLTGQANAIQPVGK